MELPRVHVYQFALGAHWGAGESVESYLRQLVDQDFAVNLRADRLAAMAAFLDEAFQLAYSLGWSGGARSAPQMFALPGMAPEEALYLVAWEQEDGITYMASPYPLTWLDAKATRTTDSSRAVPVGGSAAPRTRPVAELPPEPAAVEAPAEAEDPFAEFVRMEEAARLAREATTPAEEERDPARRFF